MSKRVGGMVQLCGFDSFGKIYMVNYRTLSQNPMDEMKTVMVLLVYTGDGAAPDDTQLIVGDIPASANLPLDPNEEPPSFFLGTLEANYPELYAFLLPAWENGVHPGEVKYDGSEGVPRASVCVRVWADYKQAHRF